jgi:hypothetical protein
VSHERVVRAPQRHDRASGWVPYGSLGVVVAGVGVFTSAAWSVRRGWEVEGQEALATHQRSGARMAIQGVRAPKRSSGLSRNSLTTWQLVHRGSAGPRLVGAHELIRKSHQ